MEQYIPGPGGRLRRQQYPGIAETVTADDQRPLGHGSLTHYSVCLKHAEEFPLDDWRLSYQPEKPVGFCWAPHLTPDDRYIIDRHVFRCPAVIFAGEGWVTALMPDLRCMMNTRQRWYLDLDAQRECLTIGMGEAAVAEHVLFRHAPGQVLHGTETALAFYLFHSTAPQDVENPFRAILAFYWETSGKALWETGKRPDYRAYCDHAYRWAFQSWPAVWQEFEMEGHRVGAPAFIVTAAQSPNADGPGGWRECLSVWNQAWFQSLRSAAGLYRYARRTGDERLKAKALMTKELALAMPRTRQIARAPGLFYSVVATPMATAEGRAVSLGWENHYFGNSNRNPVTDQLRESPFHLTDMSLTCLQMLLWYEELERDERLLRYSRTYAESLLTYQDDRGFFPAWVDADGAPLNELAQSPESSASVWFLFRLYRQTGERRYLASARRALEAVLRDIVPSGRWEDFETYYSCCRYGLEHQGRRFERSGMYKQCNLSMYWTAEACLAAYQLTDDGAYLNHGRRVLDEMLMTQAIWNPPYMPAEVFGGFGVMNCDGEWLDARQSLFAEAVIQYGMALDEPEYIQRGLAALRASFAMMYCPENPTIRRAWEEKYPFFGPEDYGFTMENLMHDGYPQQAMGEFAIYDWGAGAAGEAYQRILDHAPELFQ